MPSSLPTPRSRKLPLSALVLTLVVLYLAKEVLIPLALAVLFSFLLAPLVRRLERYHIARVPAVLLVTLLVVCAFAGIAWITATQVVDLANKIPSYQGNIQSKLDALRGQGGSLRSAADVLAKIDQKAAASAKTATQQTGAHSTASPVNRDAGEPDQPPLAVRIVEPPASPPQFLRNLFGPLLAPLGTAGVVVIFTVFMLMAREDLRDRLLHLAGPERLPLTTQAVDEAGSRVSRYLQAEVAVNLTMGVAVAAGLFLIHVPNAALWGLLAALFRFVPYVGFWLSSLAPLALSLAAFHSWWPVALTAALFITLEVITSNAIEPWIYGASTGLSPVAVVIAATFWTWLWGGVGLLLSTPLTVCIVVLGRYVPQLEFLHTLLGDEPVLPLDTRLYQRLLAFDQEEVSELIDTCLTTGSYAELYDEVIIPTLNQSQVDAQHGALGEDRQQYIRQTLRTLAEELCERPPVVAAPAEEAPGTLATASVAAGAGAAAAEPLPVRVLILPVKTDADEIAGLLLKHLLTGAGIGSEVVPFKALVSEMVAEVSQRAVPMVCLSAVRPFAVMQARHLAKRLRSALPDLKILIGLWDAKTAATASRHNLAGAHADWVVSSLIPAVDQVRQIVQSLPEISGPAAPLQTVQVPA